MGLFSSKKITYVDSVAYNMAGDENERVSYIKALVLKNITSGTNSSMSDTLRSGYLHGPSIDFRSFYRWCKTNYTTVGMPNASINGPESLNDTVIQGQLPPRVGASGYLQQAQIESADYTSWAEQWILENRPADFNTAWQSFFLETDQIYIEFVDNTNVTFTPVDFNKDNDYLYILYNYLIENVTDPTVTGPTVTLTSGQSFPSTSGWIVDSDVTTTLSQSLNKVTTIDVVYSDGTPSEHTETTDTTSQSYTNRNSHFHKTDYIGQDPNVENTRLINRKSDMYFFTNISINQMTNTTTVVDGTKTTTTTVVQDVLTVTRTYRIDTTDTVISEYSGSHIWLYRIKSGVNPVLENMIAAPSILEGEFYPAIPVRLDNKFLSPTYYTSTYDQTVKAYKKATKQKFSKLIDDLNDNPNLGDIDYAFVSFGVSLNVKENASKKYLYNFFKRVSLTQHYGPADLATFGALNNTANLWTVAQVAYMNGTGPSPGPRPPIPNLYTNEIQIKTTGTVNIPFDIRLQWVSMQEGIINGLGKPDAMVGDVWLVNAGSVSHSRLSYRTGVYNHNGAPTTQLIIGDPYVIEHLQIYWQISATQYKYIDLYGLNHVNYVYNGKYVDISGAEALADTDESGFVVPMHYQTVRSMSLKDSTQMSTACCFIVFNCYKIVKQKWYEKGIFRIIFIVLFVIVSAVFTGGAGIGLLGTSIAVGASLGFSGLAAAIVGAVVNALAAVVLTQIITTLSTAVFGEQFGALIGAVLSFIAMNVAVAFQSMGSFDWSSLMKADNLLKLTDAISKGYQGIVQGNVQSLQQQTQNLQTSYKEQSKSISESWANNIGYSDVAFNPAWITQSNVSYNYEGSSTFLSRTLLTGSDIADLTMSMISQYSGLNLTLPAAYG